jgi:hypothetical protein
MNKEELKKQFDGLPKDQRIFIIKCGILDEINCLERQKDRLYKNYLRERKYINDRITLLEKEFNKRS